MADMHVLNNDRTRADAYWAGGGPGATADDALLRGIADLKGMRIRNGPPLALDNASPPRAFEIPVQLRLDTNGGPVRVQGSYRLRARVDGQGWEITSASLQPTLDYGRRLAALGLPAWIRFVLVPGLTDAHDNVDKLADLVAPMKNVERVEILPFHQMGRDKWHKLGLKYELDGFEPPKADLTERVRGQFRSRGLTVY